MTLLGRLVPERRDSRTQLLLVERSIAIIIPLAEQVDQLDLSAP